MGKCRYTQCLTYVAPHSEPAARPLPFWKPCTFAPPPSLGVCKCHYLSPPPPPLPPCGRQVYSRSTCHHRPQQFGIFPCPNLQPVKTPPSLSRPFSSSVIGPPFFLASHGKLNSPPPADYRKIGQFSSGTGSRFRISSSSVVVEATKDPSSFSSAKETLPYLFQ